MLSNMDTKLFQYNLITTHMFTAVTIRHEGHVCQLTLVRLIAVVGETVGTAANQTQLASETGRAARQSWHWLANVRVPDSEGVARLLRGTAGMAADAVRHNEDQTRKRRQQNAVSHCPAVGLSLWEGERKQVAQSQKTQLTIIGQCHSNETLYSVVSRPSNDSHWLEKRQK